MSYYQLPVLFVVLGQPVDHLHIDHFVSATARRAPNHDHVYRTTDRPRDYRSLPHTSINYARPGRQLITNKVLKNARLAKKKKKNENERFKERTPSFVEKV